MLKFIAAGAHLGSTNVDYQMLQYVYKRKPDGKQGMQSDISDHV